MAADFKSRSNLDVTLAHMVRRGSLVSWHGFRFRICRVRSGHCYPTLPIELSGKVIHFLPCSSVQVVFENLASRH